MVCPESHHRLYAVFLVGNKLASKSDLLYVLFQSTIFECEVVRRRQYDQLSAGYLPMNVHMVRTDWMVAHHHLLPEFLVSQPDRDGMFEF